MTDRIRHREASQQQMRSPQQSHSAQQPPNLVQQQLGQAPQRPIQHAELSHPELNRALALLTEAIRVGIMSTSQAQDLIIWVRKRPEHRSLFIVHVQGIVQTSWKLDPNSRSRHRRFIALTEAFLTEVESRAQEGLQLTCQNQAIRQQAEQSPARQHSSAQQHSPTQQPSPAQQLSPAQQPSPAQQWSPVQQQVGQNSRLSREQNEALISMLSEAAKVTGFAQNIPVFMALQLHPEKYAELAPGLKILAKLTFDPRDPLAAKQQLLSTATQRFIAAMEDPTQRQQSPVQRR